MAVEDAKSDSAVDPYAAKLRATAGSLPVLDLIHPGLGAHEHTTSLVPGDPVLQDNALLIADVAATWQRMQGK
jgi:6-phosphogluconolactonase/glucosamine-6-phosphate isomerase/deaminase